MPTCAKCENDVNKVYDCDHTNEESYCKECYTELHYNITEEGKTSWKNPLLIFHIALNVTQNYITTLANQLRANNIVNG